MKTGEVMAAHCGCMAGNSGACSHVGAVLFALEYATKLKDTQTCTTKLCSWLPSYVPNAPFAEVRDYDFTSAKTKHKKMTCEVNSPGVTVTPRTPRSALDVCELKISESGFNDFLRGIVSSEDDFGAIFRVLPEFCDKHVPQEPSKFQSPLLNLYDPTAPKSYEDILKICQGIFNNLCISAEDIVKVEELTRTQGDCEEWFKWRIGMITASVMKSVCHAPDLFHPPMTTVKQICNPLAYRGKTTSMTRGNDLEPEALKAFVEHMKQRHANFKVNLLLKIECL